MAFDFPNSPSVGTRVTGVGGIVYVWDGVKWTNSVGGVTVQSMGDVGRNLLHNPLFNVQQRGAGPWAGGIGPDRWQLYVVGDTASASILTLDDANRTAIGDEQATYAHQNTFTGTAGATAETVTYQSVENVRRLANKTITVSFYARTLSGTLKFGVSASQYFGTGGSPSAGVGVNGTAPTISAAWQRYSVTLTIPSIAGKTIGTNNDHTTQIVFWYSAGSSFAASSGGVGVQSGTIYLWGMQLEIGSVATPLEKPDPRYDLSNCQRFYQILNVYSNGYIGSASGIAISVPFLVTMRVMPTSVINSNGSFGITAVGVSQITSSVCYVYGTAAAGGISLNVGLNMSADL